jgi:transposase
MTDRSHDKLKVCAEHVADQYCTARTIHFIMDNLNIHCKKSLVDAFGEQKGGDLWNRLIVHYTPKHGSWLNQAEIELSLYSRQCLGKRRIPDLKTLQKETQIWNRDANRRRTKINWQFTRKKARKVFRYNKPRGCSEQV